MENSPPAASSLEKQIDNFLEHFKRSASKAMEAEWCSIGVVVTTGSGATTSTTMATTNTSTTTVETTFATQPLQQPQQQQAFKQVTMDKHHLLQRTRSRSSCLDLNNMMMETMSPSTSAAAAAATIPAVAATPAEADSQLFSTLCEIDKNNYLFLFEKCKQFNIKAHQLRYLEKEHIRDLIPKVQLGILAEFEYLLHEWKIQKGFIKPEIITIKNEDEPKIRLKTDIFESKSSTMASKHIQTKNIETHSIGVNTEPVEAPIQLQATSYFNTPNFTDDNDLLTTLSYQDDSMNMSGDSPMSSTMDRPKYDYETFCDIFTLEKIIPLVLKRCKQNYKIKKLLTESDRRLLASSIVDYFEIRRIKMRPDVFENLAEQISEHFPTEGRKAWYHRQNSKGRGRLYMRFYNSHRTKENRQLYKKRKLMELADASSSVEEPVSSLLEDIEAMDNDENAKRIQNFLKSNVQIKCEDFTEITDAWEDTLKYRRLQMKYLTDLEGIREFLENWPSYKLTRGYELLNIDYDHQFPTSMSTFHSRWLVYKQKIEALLEAELKDNHCLELLTKYKQKRHSLNEDSSSCALVYMIHAITKPYRVFKTATGSVRYCITDSQYSMTRLIHSLEEMNEYNEPYPCIFVLGETLLDIEECYVIFLDIKYRLSYAECLVVCMQLFSLFKLDDPLPSLHFWQFIRGYLFDIPKNNERPYAVMENIVSYLESVSHA